jgi:hypothetical protein
VGVVKMRAIGSPGSQFFWEGDHSSPGSRVCSAQTSLEDASSVFLNQSIKRLHRAHPPAILSRGNISRTNTCLQGEF